MLKALGENEATSPMLKAVCSGHCKQTVSILQYGFPKKTLAAENGKTNRIILDHFADAKFGPCLVRASFVAC